MVLRLWFVIRERARPPDLQLPSIDLYSQPQIKRSPYDEKVFELRKNDALNLRIFLIEGGQQT